MTTKHTTNKVSKKNSAKSTSNTFFGKVAAHDLATLDDFKSALLLVSLLINAGILVGWIALQVTTQYDLQVATFLFIR